MRAPTRAGLRRRAAVVRDRLRRTPQEAAAGPARGSAGPLVPGMVEKFSDRLVTGWVSVPPGSPPTRVDLVLGAVKATSTYATPEAAESDGEQGRRAKGRPGAPVPGPPGGRRNSGQQIRTFAFKLDDLWDYARRGTRIAVRVDGQPLPIAGHGMYLTPPRRGAHTPDELRQKFDEGFVLSQFGVVQLSKKLDTRWQQDVMGLYTQVRSILRDEFGHEAFVVYGTLLGAVREQGYIGHDIDFDAAYVSKHNTGPEAAAELADIGLTLVAHGLEVECYPNALHIQGPAGPDSRIDLFHTFFDEGGVLRFPFGVAGTSTITHADWNGTREIEFPGGRCLVPDNAEQLVRHLYGDDWRQPKPGFNWGLDRTDQAPEGRVPEELRTKVYWANFYAHHEYTTGSSFFEWMVSRDDTPDTVIDIGCGDGRDACAFGSTGRTVLGLDQSPVGIEHAQAHATARGLDNVSFRVCDVADVVDLGEALHHVVDDASGPTLFYLRFFLHAIHEDVQALLLEAIGTHARPGDVFAAEFRTDKDEHNTKVHTKHYRRFQNAGEFVAALEAQGWQILHQEERAGLSPYQGEDPVLCRVVAGRASSPAES